MTGTSEKAGKGDGAPPNREGSGHRGRKEDRLQGAVKACEVLRGRSNRPVFIIAAGMSQE
jgi:hypothetical protein